MRLGDQLETPADGEEAGVGHVERLFQPAVQHPADGVAHVALPQQERLGLGIAGQEAGRLAAAVQPQVERVVRPGRPGKDRGRTPAGQVGLRPPQQFRADAAAARCAG